jgi:FixJ family two-component response regulator
MRPTSNTRSAARPLQLGAMARADEHVPGLVSIVDEDASVRRALRRLIESAGFTVETFASCEEVLHRGFLERPACLVIDVHLGDMNGSQLQLRLTAEGLAIPTIFVTAHDDAVTEGIAERAGCVTYLTKPIDGDVLLDAIRRAVASLPPSSPS